METELLAFGYETPRLAFVSASSAKLASFQCTYSDPVDQVSLDVREVQPENGTPEESIREVAREKARAAFAIIKRPLIVQDAGLFIAALGDGNFPGPFTKQVGKSLGPNAFMEMLRSTVGEAPEASWVECAVYEDAHSRKVVTRTRRGSLVLAPMVEANKHSGLLGRFFKHEDSKMTVGEMSEDEWFAYEKGINHSEDSALCALGRLLAENEGECTLANTNLIFSFLGDELKHSAINLRKSTFSIEGHTFPQISSARFRDGLLTVYISQGVRMTGTCPHACPRACRLENCGEGWKVLMASEEAIHSVEPFPCVFIGRTVHAELSVTFLSDGRFSIYGGVEGRRISADEILNVFGSVLEDGKVE